MAENTQKKDRPPVRVSPEMKMLIEAEASRLRLFEYEVIERMWAVYHDQPKSAITKSGDAEDTNPDSSVRSITDNREVPQNKCVSSLGQNTDAVISCLQKHWGDEDFRACILGTLRTWDVGDSNIKDSLTRNCETFARSSDMVEALSEVQVQSGKVPPGYAERVKELLRRSYRSQQKAPKPEKPNHRGARGGT